MLTELIISNYSMAFGNCFFIVDPVLRREKDIGNIEIALIFAYPRRIT